MRDRSPAKPGIFGSDPLAFGARLHAREPAPASRRAARLGALASVEIEAQPRPAPAQALRKLLTVHVSEGNRRTALPEWDDLRSMMLEIDAAA